MPFPNEKFCCGGVCCDGMMGYTWKVFVDGTQMKINHPSNLTFPGGWHDIEIPAGGDCEIRSGGLGNTYIALQFWLGVFGQALYIGDVFAYRSGNSIDGFTWTPQVSAYPLYQPNDQATATISYDPNTLEFSGSVTVYGETKAFVTTATPATPVTVYALRRCVDDEIIGWYTGNCMDGIVNADCTYFDGSTSDQWPTGVCCYKAYNCDPNFPPVGAYANCSDCISDVVNRVTFGPLGDPEPSIYSVDGSYIPHLQGPIGYFSENCRCGWIGPTYSTSNLPPDIGSILPVVSPVYTYFNRVDCWECLNITCPSGYTIDIRADFSNTVIANKIKLSITSSCPAWEASGTDISIRYDRTDKRAWVMEYDDGTNTWTGEAIGSSPVATYVRTSGTIHNFNIPVLNYGCSPNQQTYNAYAVYRCHTNALTDYYVDKSSPYLNGITPTPSSPVVFYVYGVLGCFYLNGDDYNTIHGHDPANINLGIDPEHKVASCANCCDYAGKPTTITVTLSGTVSGTYQLTWYDDFYGYLYDDGTVFINAPPNQGNIPDFPNCYDFYYADGTNEIYWTGNVTGTYSTNDPNTTAVVSNP